MSPSVSGENCVVIGVPFRLGADGAPRRAPGASQTNAPSPRTMPLLSEGKDLLLGTGLRAWMRFLPASPAIVPLCTLLPDVWALQPRWQQAKQLHIVGGMH
mmetsp:Transcript_31237/g.71428  ORF Transcript_31237/g.71428 Transcript_31237/m.71428 type:complete len:101 (-) Transcript_31237:514-816(-)